jgi:hypothetical protein
VIHAEFHKVVNHMLTIDEFAESWKFLIEKYNLKTHIYMTNLYEIHHEWVKPYLKGVFCAKMTSTQHSESENHMLKNDVPHGCPMHMPWTKSSTYMAMMLYHTQMRPLICHRIQKPNSLTDSIYRLVKYIVLQ